MCSQTAAPQYKWVWGVFSECEGVGGGERESVCVCMRGVRPSPLSLADGHSEDGLTQEQWGPLTKTTPPRHVASYHRGNPPWDRERADSWRGGLYKNGVHFFPLKLPSSISFPSSPCPPLLQALMNVSYISFYSFMWLTLWTWLTTDNSSLQEKHNSPRDGNKSGLYGLWWLSVIREHWSHWQI